MSDSAGPSATSSRTLRWSAYRDPAARRAAAAGARRPVLPLDSEQEELEQAVLLHQIGLSYSAISLVMGHYHGSWAPYRAWWYRINKACR